jgi:hypothetical protein
MLAILECMAKRRGGSYLLTDTDSMLFVASERGGFVPCVGGSHEMPDGSRAVKAITWKQVDEICEELNSLNPYTTAAPLGEFSKLRNATAMVQKSNNNSMA